MNAIKLTPQMILGFSGESSCSCSEIMAKELLRKIREKSKAIKYSTQPSAARLGELLGHIKEIEGV